MSKLSGVGWISKDVIDGVREVVCENWLGFVNFLNGKLSEYEKYVYRGHASSAWKLESSLDRLVEQAPNKTILKSQMVKKRAAHLQNFKFATRGRRQFPIELSDDDWWALGQHHGLATPLLDWTESPYVAAYFALSANHKVMTERCVVFGLSTSFVEQINNNAELLKKSFWGDLKLFTPQSDENIRLVSQRGLFSIAQYAPSVEEWISEHAIGYEKAALLKITIPASERDIALRNLNRMNVNHLSLFPDLYGASKYCNFKLSVDKY